MAKVLKSFDFTGRSGAAKYPWNEWLDGRVWELSFDHDVKSKSKESFRSSCHLAAERLGGSCRTSISGDKIVIQFVPNE